MPMIAKCLPRPAPMSGVSSLRIVQKARPRVFAGIAGYCILFALAVCGAGVVKGLARLPHITATALYPRDERRLITVDDNERYTGAGVLMCRTDFGGLERAAAAWLIGARNLVVLNAHNFVDRSLEPTRPVTDCFFRIAGDDYEFDPESLSLGVDANSKALHITDDWALVRLRQAVAEPATPQPIPDANRIVTGSVEMKVIMVSPAGHSNFRLPTSLEACQIHKIDAPTDGLIRRARHDCNDGYGGSGSGIFTEKGDLIAMHSASLEMNRRRPFDLDQHYGSTLLFEGALVAAIRGRVGAPTP